MSTSKRRPFLEQFFIAAAPSIAEQAGQALRAFLRRREEARAAAEQAAREAAANSPKRRR